MFLFNMFPNIHPNHISSMKYELQKYRNFWPHDGMSSSEFLYVSSRLTKDMNDKNLDPFPHKMVQMVKPNG